MRSLEVLFDRTLGSVSKTPAHVPVNRGFVSPEDGMLPMSYSLMGLLLNVDYLLTL
ncbi:hypothetical protein J9B83_04565 [Marinomonas sp. A79]|uniref:Uncharacterized protein n=1 Tax=Marinomonas vulgaris TaxID=2823372 RepID=A0ABS5H935_9GAMM|nr:hypothetical protein [Marinomonas vulgaris]MBR7888208.1 hypothetical protein [Marinomonas vulgaris]